eukprot:6486195-Alexandrium_andersonii.AAC.1
MPPTWGGSTTRKVSVIPRPMGLQESTFGPELSANLRAGRRRWTSRGPAARAAAPVVGGVRPEDRTADSCSRTSVAGAVPRSAGARMRPVRIR